jgi:hypothetical protein
MMAELEVFASEFSATLFGGVSFLALVVYIGLAVWMTRNVLIGKQHRPIALIEP